MNGKRILTVCLVLALLVALGTLALKRKPSGESREVTVPSTTVSETTQLDGSQLEVARTPSEPTAASPQDPDRAPAANEKVRRKGDGDGSGKLVAIRGVALHSDGSAFVMTPLKWTIVRMGHATDAASTRSKVRSTTFEGDVLTTNQGEFQLQVERPRAIPDTWRELMLSDDTARGFASIQALDQETIDVGIVKLEEPRVLFAGQVVDHDGAGIAGVFLMTADRGDDWGSKVVLFGPAPRARTDETGRFAMKGFTDARRLTMWVTHFDYEQQVFENLDLPAPSLRIQLERSVRPSIQVRVILDDPGCADLIEVLLSGADPSTKNMHMQRIEPLTWRLSALSAGTWSVSIRAQQSDLIHWDDIVVPATGPVTDPRLEAVDLRGRVECLRFRVVSEEGRPLSKTEVPIEGREPIRSDEQGWVAIARKPGTRTTVTTPAGRRILVDQGMEVVMDP